MLEVTKKKSAELNHDCSNLCNFNDIAIANNLVNELNTLALELGIKSLTNSQT